MFKFKILETSIHQIAKNHQIYPNFSRITIILGKTHNGLMPYYPSFVVPYVADNAEMLVDNGNICARCAKIRYKIFSVKIILNMV